MTTRRASPFWLAPGALVVVGAAYFFFVRADAPGPTVDTPDSASGVVEAASAATRSTARPPQPREDEADGRVPRDDEANERPEGGAEPAPLASGSTADAISEIRALADQPGEAAVRTLVDRMRSRDDVVVAEAAKALVARKATSAIRAIASIDLPTAAGSGLSVIDALGKLGAVASGGERTAAIERLLSMLAEEKARLAPESPGNLIQIYEALGQLGDPRAARALEGELLDPSVPRAPKVVIVKSLVQIGQQESRGPLETARTEQSVARADDAFEEEIRVELVGEIDKALKEL